VVTVGAIEAGRKHNTIPEKALLKGTTRAFDPDVRQQILDELERACSIARALGGDFRLTIVEGFPPTVNDPEMTTFVQKVASEPERRGHSPTFDINENALPVGAALLAEVAWRYLRQRTSPN
jgi:amidohydrolase